MPDSHLENYIKSNFANIYQQLVFLYGARLGQRVLKEIELFQQTRRESSARPSRELDQREVILITYGDQLRAPGEKPLRTLANFCGNWLRGIISAIHLLPFFPYSSDDGFAVIDYTRVDPQLGDWGEIAEIGRHFGLMFDLVINHVSASSSWFKGFLQDDPKYQRYFIVVEGQPDLSAVIRPRALPLLTSFQTPSGEKQVWTTFSDDQIDLNFSNPDVLLEMLKIMLLYVEKGARFIRLDAIAYLWKQIGSACIHLPQTHRVVQLLRSFLDIHAPQVQLITETNVPHSDNLSYFGDGSNEAQLIYNFALPPLVLHTLRTGSVDALSQWAQSLSLPSSQVTFFNFLASHDGIGITPVRDILTAADYQALVEASVAHGGYVSYKAEPDGSRSPYELNINYFDALSDPHRPETQEVRVKRFLAAHAIMLCLVGVPGIYFHSLFGSRNWLAGVEESGRYRSINRQKLDLQHLEGELSDKASLRAAVYDGLSRLLRLRRSQKAFDPYGSQKVVDCGEGIFGLLREATPASDNVLCLQNIRAETEQLEIQPGQHWPGVTHDLLDLVSGETFSATGSFSLNFEAYQVRWLVKRNE